MNHPASIATTGEAGATPSVPTWTEKVYERILLRALSPLERGQLELQLPDGRVVKLGTGAVPSGLPFSGRGVVHIRRFDFFRKCVLYGDIGFAESYIDGDWETDDIDDVVSWFILNAEHSPASSASRMRQPAINLLRWLNRKAHSLRRNSRAGSQNNISAHYDLSNELFATFLDDSMTYSCAFFGTRGDDLSAAQTRKYDLLCRKLRLRPSDHLLEIGSGWGGFAIHAARTYGCRVTTVTISAQQYDYAKTRIEREGLSDQIEIRLSDYRDLKGNFDKIASIEMLEAVGHDFLETYFEKIHELLRPDGLLALQVITCADSRYEALRKDIDFIQKHIFPGSLILSLSVIQSAINRTGDLFLHHLEDFGPHYARTLELWHEAFEKNVERVRSLGFDESFVRKWKYYLLYCKAGFQMRHTSVVQAVYTRANNFALEPWVAS